MKSRRYFLKGCSMAATAALLLPKSGSLFASGFDPTEKNIRTLTLLHTNDLHNQLKSFDHDAYVNLGGFENTAQVISKIKRENENVMLFDAGDIFSGSPGHQREHDRTLQVMHSLGYDATVPGNRDFLMGGDYLHEQSQKNSLPLVATNYSVKTGHLKNILPPYKIVTKGGIRVGVIAAGVALADNGNDQVQYRDPVKHLTAVAKMLKLEEKCELVICLSHLGYKNDKTIDDLAVAKETNYIDVIIGGHSHTFMGAPYIARNIGQQEVIINHAGLGGMALGNMKFTFDDYGKVRMVNFDNLMIGTTGNKWMRNKDPFSA